jgi:Lipoprotein confined to pathogenic Mycobacterium
MTMWRNTFRRRTVYRTAVVAVVIATSSTGCYKPTTLDPNANPGRGELDRLQKIVNDRPDLETVQRQLADLDTRIRAAVAKYSPETKFSSTPISHPTNGCNDPFVRTIGRQIQSDQFAGKPGAFSEHWLQITTELDPVFSAAGFHANDVQPGQPPRPLSADNDSQMRDDGALINLVNHGSLIAYDYDTGCHLPAAWRSAPPPPDMRPPNDPNVHYPYLYGSPGGRNVDAY